MPYTNAKVAQRYARIFSQYAFRHSAHKGTAGANAYVSKDGNTYQYITDGRLAVRYNVPFDGLTDCHVPGIDMDPIFDLVEKAEPVAFPKFEEVKLELGIAHSKDANSLKLIRLENGWMFDAYLVKRMMELLGTSDDVQYRALKDKGIVTGTVKYGSRTITAVLSGILVRYTTPSDYVIDMKN